MNVLMLSIDKTLLGEQSSADFAAQGDTINRHKKYGEYVDKLNIVVTSPPGYKHAVLSEKVEAYPTNSNTFLGHGMSSFRYAESFVKHGGIDLIVAQDITSPAAWFIRKRFKIPYIITFHAADWNTPEWKEKIINRLILPIERFAIRRADGLRVVSQEMKKRFSSFGVTCPITVVPTPSDHSIFINENKEKVQEIRHRYHDKTILLTIGRLEAVKNIPLILEAFLEVKHVIPSVVLIIVGEGSKQAEIEQTAKDLGIADNVHLLGSMPYHEQPPYIQAADVFVLSSNSESLGKVLLHAGAAGKPSIATKTLGAKGIIKDGKTGILVDVGNKTQLAHAMIRLCKDESLRKQMGTAAQEHVLEYYDAEKNIIKLIEFWQEIINNNS